MPYRIALLFAFALACDATAPGDAGTPGADAAPRIDAGPPRPPPATGVLPSHPRTLPFALARPDVGAPVSAAEIAEATDRYLELLARTGWLDLVADRAHGWPESDPEGRYWYATWWSGAGVQVRGGALSYVHVAVGADNNGLRTPQLLEGACYAYLLWRDPREQHLVRRLMRGLSSWHRAMRRSADDRERGLLSRAAYPRSVMDVERGIFIDYEASRPGIDADPSDYVHVPDNPDWPDVYIKNTRSKDDMGHLLRAVALIDSCDGELGTDAQIELVEMRRLYQEWAQRVEADDYRIATLDAERNVFFPSGDLATYITRLGIECGAGYAIPLLSRYETLGYECTNHGLGPVADPPAGVSNSSAQILRTHHEAAVSLALVTGNAAIAEDLLEGLATRLDGILDAFDAGETPDNANPSDVAQLALESAAMGLPLTSREVRFLHARIAEAHAAFDPSLPDWDLRAAPDGDYRFEPPSAGIDWKDLGLLLGLCAGQWVDPSGRAVIDCDRVRAAGRP